MTVATALTVNLVSEVVPVPAKWWWPPAVWALLGTIVVVTVIIEWLRGRPDPAALPQGTDPLDAASDLLATATARYWTAEAGARSIDANADPIGVRWTADLKQSVTPGEAATTQPPATEGTATDLHDTLYARIDRGQLVLLGEAGAGKTAAMVILLLDVLRQRAEVDSPRERARMPVPVWLNLGSWNLDQQPLTEYVASTLESAYPALRHPRYGRGAATRLVEEQRVALFLDGLDEMPSALRLQALKAITKQAAGLRIVLSSRPEGYEQARRGGRLARPITVRLQPVAAAFAAEYLQRGHDTDEQAQRWKKLLDFVRDQPDSPVAQAFSSPLALSLARTAFDGLDGRSPDPMELTRLDTPAAVLGALISQFIEHAYPQQNRQRRRALAHLSFIAHHLDGARDLNWWQIPTWVRFERLALACALVFGALSGLAAFAAFGALGGFGGGTWTYAAGAALLAAGHVTAFANVAYGKGPTGMAPHRPSYADAVRLLNNGLTVGLPFGLGVGLAKGVRDGAVVGIGFLVVAILGIGVTDGPAGGLLRLWTKPLADSPASTPYETYRTDRRRTVITTIVGGIVGGVVVTAAAMTEEFTLNWLAIGLLIGLTTGFSIGLGPAILLNITRLVLAASGRPAGRTMPILQTALHRQVLRQVGASYQFRHAELQDHLATQYRRERGVPAPIPAQPTGVAPASQGRPARRAGTRPAGRRPAGRR